MKLSYEHIICPYCNTHNYAELFETEIKLLCTKCGFSFLSKKKIYPNGKLVFQTRRMNEIERSKL